MKLALDAGHGMGNRRPGVYDSGAVAGGVTEADIALQITLAVKFYCEGAGVAYHLFRTGKTDSNPVGGRDEEAEKAGCTHFLSIHCNAASDATANGTETFYRDRTDMLWAARIQKLALDAWGLKDRGLKPETASQHSRLAVFDFDGPSALLEVGFLTNPRDRAALQSRANRMEFAAKLLDILKGA